MEATNEQAPVIRFGEWFLTIFIVAIPIVGQVMLFVWAFGSGTNPTKANWAKASLVWVAIALLLYFLVFAAIFAAFMRGAK